MAIITKGYIFESGQVVTETNLNDLVDEATISNIATGDIADGAITNIKIAAVDAGKVTTGTLSVDRIANNSLPLTKLAAGALPSTVTVNSANITNLTIVDADIANAANINDTKLATISTGGKVANSATTATSANTASAIVARDASGNFSAGSITASADLLISDKMVHTGDTDTSVRFPTADVVAVETAGVERLRVAANGYIGVNESAPAQMIHVSLSDFPGIALEATGEGTNEKTCDIINNGGALELRLVNDAYNNSTTALKVERSGFSVAQQRFYTGNTVERMTIKSGGQVRFVPLAADPAGAEEGDVYFNSVLKKLAVYDGTNWVAMH